VECAADGDEVPQVAEAVEDLLHLTTTVGERRCAEQLTAERVERPAAWQ
jgi:hypothetical protein